MKKLFIHIGPHKTGTTYLQKVLLSSKDELEKHGVYYPDNLVGPQWGHHKLVEAVRRKDDKVVKDYFDSLNSNSIISSENFENLTFDEITYLFGFLEDYRVEVIFVKRSFSDLLISNWQEDVKHGSDLPWSAFILNHVIKPYSSVILNQSETLKKWQKHCDAIRVIDYDDLKSTGVDLLDFFINEIFLLKGLEISTGQHVNASMDYADVEIIRILNGLYRNEFGKLPLTQIRDTYLDIKHQGCELLSKISESLATFMVDVDLSTAWGVSFFSDEFRRQFQPGVVKDSKLRKSYLLPRPDMGYIIINYSYIEELYCLIKEEMK